MTTIRQPVSITLWAAALCLFSTATAFRTERIVGAYRAVKANVRAEEGDVSDADIAKWVKE